MDNKEIKLILSNNPPFNKLKERQINRLLKICTFREYKNQEVIYGQGDPSDYLYILLKGRVEVLTKDQEGEHTIEIIKRGVCFGIISLLTDDAHSVTTRSIERSYILQIKDSEFKEFLKKNPYVSLDFSRMLSQRVKSRSKPKRIFRSRKIAILDGQSKDEKNYIFDLGLKLKEQTAKEVISLQFIDTDKKDYLDRNNNILNLKQFKEESLTDYIAKKDIDLLYLEPGSNDNFIALLNFLSESYHFIIYEIPQPFSHDLLEQFISPAHQVHFLALAKKSQLKPDSVLIKKIKTIDPLNEDKLKVILKQDKKKHFSSDKVRAVFNHSVYATLPNSSSTDYPKVLKRIARDIGEVTLGLALGSGAAYGFAHIGILKVLEESSIDIDIICGSSMGAVIGALWAADFTSAEIEQHAKEIAREISRFSPWRLCLPFKGIMRSRHLENIFKRIFKDLTFSDLKHTLKIVAFDFLKRKTVILQEGALYKAVAASCAFPGIFEPIKFKRDYLLDGGILNPLPTKILLNFNTKKIIASNITLSQEQVLREYKKREKFHIFDFVFGSIETMQQYFVQQALEISDVVIHSNLEGLGWTEFNKVEEFIERGEEAARENIGEIQKLVAS